MRKTLFSLMSCTLLSSCTTITSHQEKYTLAVQVYADSPVITEVIQKVTPLINNIIKEELALDKSYDFEFFLPKKRQRISLYYLENVEEKNNPLIISRLDAMNLGKRKLEHVKATSNTEFFGERKDELVITIDDSKKELSALNQEFKRNFSEYHQRFPFIPHMGLGRVRFGAIGNHTQSEDVVQHIKKRVKELSSKIMRDALSPKSQKLNFISIGLLNLHKQIYLKEWN